MRIAVFVEPMPGNGFRASGTEPFAVSAEGATRQEAIARLKDEVQARIRGGGEIVTLEIGPEPHPLAKYAGMFPDDALTKDWEAAMTEYRRNVDQGPEIP
ncbi:MAG: hypothetical protein L0Y72_21030 [Gemmataceae bacterium]|nr:hypothetical protein [Gemmataceae bacterium]MCI0741526.1 hypothetical protein [Gemmataceae bacterium]